MQNLGAIDFPQEIQLLGERFLVHAYINLGWFRLFGFVQLPS